MDKLYDIESRFPEVQIVPWVFSENHNHKYPNSQFAMLKQVVTKNRGCNILNFDPDEFLYLHNYQDNINNLLHRYSNFNLIKIKSVQCEPRVRGRPIKDLGTVDEEDNTVKWIHTTGNFKYKKFHVHWLLYRGKKIINLPRDECYFRHYKYRDV